MENPNPNTREFLETFQADGWRPCLDMLVEGEIRLIGFRKPAPDPPPAPNVLRVNVAERVHVHDYLP